MSLGFAFQEPLWRQDSGGASAAPHNAPKHGNVGGDAGNESGAGHAESNAGHDDDTPNYADATGGDGPGGSPSNSDAGGAAVPGGRDHS